MKHRPLKQLCGLLASAAIALVLIGCNGKAGQNGTNGKDGLPGTPAPAPTVDAAQLTADQWAALQPTLTITGTTIPAAGTPQVTFTVVDNLGNVIKNLDKFDALSKVADRSGNFATVHSYPNFNFAIAKLVPEDAVTKAPSKWVSYLVSTVPTKKADGTAVAALPGKPTTDTNGNLVANADGSYTYTFYRDIKGMAAWLALPATQTAATAANAANDVLDCGNVSYDPTLVHRVVLQFSGAARGTGSNTPDGVTVATAVNLNNPVNAIFDFTPGTTGVGAKIAATVDNRDVVDVNKCNECHKDFFKTAPHAGRIETRYCVVCHTEQRKYGYVNATIVGTVVTPGSGTSTNKINNHATADFPTMVHKIHMGTGLGLTGYTYMPFNSIGYSMLDGGVRMCSKCHSNVPQAANWNMKPSRLACGSCHDTVNFASTHGGTAAVPAQTSDVACAGCHADKDITTYHLTNNKTLHNPTTPAGLANFTYEISSAVATGNNVAVKFRIMKDGTPVVLGVPVAGGLTAGSTGVSGTTLPGFSTVPSFLLAWAMPQSQDGVGFTATTVPADYNNLAAANGNPIASNFQPPTVSLSALTNLTNATTVGIYGAPDASGYYTATIIGKFPTGAKMRSVSLQGYFTQVMPVTTPATPDVARHAVSVVKAVTGDTVRRVAIDSNACAKCHEWFEGHGGNRVFEVQVCVTCHVPGLTTSGKGSTNAQLTAYYPSFTVNDKDSLSRWTGVDFKVSDPVPAYAAANPASPDLALKFPQTNNNFKDMIHGIHAGKDRVTPIRIARNRSGTQTIVDGSRVGFPGVLNNCQACHTYNGYNVPTTAILASREEAINVAGNTTPALVNAALAAVNAGDLMITPFTAACYSCHDSVAAQAHMKSNGGQIKVARSALNVTLESCAVCHGVGNELDPVKVHK